MHIHSDFGTSIKGGYTGDDLRVAVGIVMLSAAKHLVANRERPFAALSMTSGGCRTKEADKSFATLSMTHEICVVWPSVTFLGRACDTIACAGIFINRSLYQCTGTGHLRDRGKHQLGKA